MCFFFFCNNPLKKRPRNVRKWWHSSQVTIIALEDQRTETSNYSGFSRNLEEALSSWFVRRHFVARECCSHGQFSVNFPLGYSSCEITDSSNLQTWASIACFFLLTVKNWLHEYRFSSPEYAAWHTDKNWAECLNKSGAVAFKHGSDRWMLYRMFKQLLWKVLHFKLRQISLFLYLRSLLVTYSGFMGWNRLQFYCIH